MGLARSLGDGPAIAHSWPLMRWPGRSATRVAGRSKIAQRARQGRIEQTVNAQGKKIARRLSGLFRGACLDQKA
jgi:hypothetical protein